MKNTIFMFLMLMFFFHVNAFSYDLVKDYFQMQNITLLTIFHCKDARAMRPFMTMLMRNGFMVSFQNIDFKNPFDVNQLKLINGREGFLLDINCKGAEPLIESAAKWYKFYELQSWLISYDEDQLNGISTEISDTNQICDEDQFSDIGSRILSNQSIFINSNVAWVQKAKCIVLSEFDRQPKWVVFEVYRIWKSRPIKSTCIGIYPDDFDSFAGKLRNARIARQNLDKVILRSAMVIEFKKDFTYVGDVNKRSFEPFLKRTFPSLVLLRDDLNFRNHLQIADAWGWPIQNTTIFDGGLMKMFQLDQIDFSMHSVLVREDRMWVVDYTSELAQVEARIIFRQPPLSTVSNIYVLPFSSTVWICICTLILIIAVAIVIQILLTRSQEPDLKELSLTDLFTFITGAICQQGSAVSPSTSSARLTMLLLFISALFLFTSYSANIVSLLQTPSKSIKTLHDLVASPLQLGIQNISYNIHFIKESPIPIVKEIYEKKIQPKGEHAFLTSPEGMKHVRRGLYAFQIDTGSAYDYISSTYTEAEKCGLAEIELYQLPRQAQTVRRKSSIRDVFAIRLRWQREIGLLDRIQKIWAPQKPKCESGNSGFVSVGTTEVMPAIQAFMYGAGLAIGLFILELVNKNYRYWWSFVAMKPGRRRPTL